MSVDVRTTVTINRPADEVYQAWRALEDLPRFTRHIESVAESEGGLTHWTVRGPGGLRLEWDAQIVADQQGQLIAWRSLPGASVENQGMVRFIPAPGGRGTEVHALIRYRPPGGVLGSAFSRVFNEGTGRLIHEDLRRFKQFLEAGEIATVEGQPSGRQEQEQAKERGK